MANRRDRELAKMLYPKPSEVVEEGLGARVQSTYAYGTATADSADGTVTVVMDGETAGVDAAIEVPTSCAISEGDTVLVSVSGNVPVEAVSKGSGDVTRGMAEATTQHFWTDADGIHVTEVTQEQFLANPTGSNQLSDSNGIKLRDGTDVLASFSASKVELGANSDSSEIELCGGKGKITYNGISRGIALECSDEATLNCSFEDNGETFSSSVGADGLDSYSYVYGPGRTAGITAMVTDGNGDFPSDYTDFNGIESAGGYVGIDADKLLFARHGLAMWENGSHNFHIMSGEDGATTQWEISIEYAGIYSRRRSRSTDSDPWGSWSSWALKVSF